MARQLAERRQVSGRRRVLSVRGFLGAKRASLVHVKRGLDDKRGPLCSDLFQIFASAFAPEADIS